MYFKEFLKGEELYTNWSDTRVDEFMKNKYNTCFNRFGRNVRKMAYLGIGIKADFKINNFEYIEFPQENNMISIMPNANGFVNNQIYYSQNQLHLTLPASMHYFNSNNRQLFGNQLFLWQQLHIIRKDKVIVLNFMCSSA